MTSPAYGVQSGPDGVGAATAPPNTPTGSRTRSRACLECGSAFEPARSWHKHCSDACRTKGWKARQAALPLEPAPVPVVPVRDQRVDASERPKLTGDNARILARLRMGEATGAQLAGWLCDEAGANASAWRTRVSDCRRWLRKHTGETIRAIRLEPRKYLYRIEAL